MSEALFNNLGGLRFWRQSEIRLRERIKAALVETMQTTLLDMNQMWRFEEVDTPVLMPRDRFSCAYSDDDVFALKDEIGGQPFALRAETTVGSYEIAQHLLRVGAIRAPACVYALGKSFRQERSDGATAAKLRFNEFYQLEFQCIYSEGTKAPIAETVRAALVPVVEHLTGKPTRIIPSDRLPSYSRETIDLECDLGIVCGSYDSMDSDEPQIAVVEHDWREVASTSLRTDFPSIPAHKPYEVFEVALGIDRLVAIAQDHV
jgi:glycyl-tRNA synthetase